MSGGGSGSRSRRGYAYQEDESSGSESESNEDTEDEASIAEREKEEAIVQHALSRIRKAQAKGKQQVKLNKEELAALEKRKQRLAAEASRKSSGASGSGSDKKRRKEKENRVSIPLSHFDALPPPSRRGKAVGGPDDALPMHPTPSTLSAINQARGPPSGVFAPPTTSSRSRPHSGTGSSHRPRSQADGRSSPFEYQYVNPPSNLRHASDPTARPPSRTSYQYEDDHRRRSGSSQSSSHPHDPFQYQTAGPRSSLRSSTPVSRDDAMDMGLAYGNLPQGNPRRSARLIGRYSSEDEETTSDEVGSGARIVRDGGREDIVVLEQRPSTSPEPERAPKSKKSSSPSKRKPVGSSSGGKKGRKGK
ncbi:uncharacterized protein B0I36DRAFT_364659 [Microdochium trichocladiopsis]|uniref:Uncharacterized protein n=1 Tax=Microdochium trichocladiopsis TaxID=1682393 RepID=A0A9P9BN89_9PEZI|nr:uncharacterized protein B0I36DRAFT_364659 [Microdochium trichocladiopsis]KAH7027461.1 hypothetical protein B0I36DRAFT_364659 [Microdochium trichocladiopsis]